MESSQKDGDIAEFRNKLKTMSQRFFDTYKNSAFANLDKIFSKNSISYFLLYDNKRIDFFNKAKGDVKLNEEI